MVKVICQSPIHFLKTILDLLRRQEKESMCIIALMFNIGSVYIHKTLPIYIQAQDPPF